MEGLLRAICVLDPYYVMVCTSDSLASHNPVSQMEKLSQTVGAVWPRLYNS